MKEAVRPRNEDPGQRSRDRQHWHEDDEKDRIYHKRFLIHIVFDILLAVGAAWLGIHFYTDRAKSEVKEIQNKVARLEKRLSARDKQLSVVQKRLLDAERRLSAKKRR